MERKIKISFLEREFFAEDRTRTTVGGYESAIIKIDGKIKLCKVIDLERLKRAESLYFQMFQTTLPLVESETDLKQILEEDENGAKWLASFEKYFLAYYGEVIPMSLSIKASQLPRKTLYDLIPKDYFKRTEGGKHYRCPEGFIESLPENAAYWEIRPPMKYKDGKWVRMLDYHRRVRDSKGVFESYSIKDSDDKDHFNLRGILLGSLNKENIEKRKGDFEECFPINHFLKITYPVTLSTARQFNPLTMEIELEA